MPRPVRLFAHAFTGSLGPESSCSPIANMKELSLYEGVSCPAPPRTWEKGGSGVLNVVTTPRSESSNQIAERHRARDLVCLTRGARARGMQ